VIEVRVRTLAGRRATHRVECSACGNVTIPTKRDLALGWLDGRGWHSTANKRTALDAAFAHGSRHHAGEFEVR
jgi:hypothetical protein